MAITIDGSASNLSTPACTVSVYRYDSAAGSYDLLPNIVCERVEWHEGIKTPRTAYFRYRLDTAGLYPNWPTQFEQIWPQTVGSGPYVVAPDDRLVVRVTDAAGRSQLFFDGFAQIPQVNLDGNTQNVTFTATGAEIRCWDTVILSRTQRDFDTMMTNDGSNEVSVDLPCRFNPSHGRHGVLFNCTPNNKDRNQGQSNSAPVFVDETPAVQASENRTYWTVDAVVRYMFYVENDGKYVQTADASTIKSQLSVKIFTEDANGNWTWSNQTAAAAPIRDLDVTNKAWPEAVDHALRTVGFGSYFALDQDSDGNPQTYMRVYQLNVWTIAKTVQLDAYSAKLDPSTSNVGHLALSRDMSRVVNSWAIETHPRLWEVSVVLSPAFTPQVGDELATNRVLYLKANLALASGTVRKRYRYYIADECGTGHWDIANHDWVTDPIDLSGIFPKDEHGKKTYVNRARPGRHLLLSLDDLKRPLNSQLAFSRDYATGTSTSVAPSLWDGTGTWQTITGGWKLLDDQLGIQVTVEDVDAWSVGHFTGPSPQERSHTLKGITSLANPGGPNTLFYLRLTTVIHDDFMLPAVLAPRVSSPTQFKRLRRHDARDHYQMWTLAPLSLYNPGNKDPKVLRDDTDKALSLAAQYRSAYEMPPIAGTITIPYLTTYYEIGDRIKTIEGRNCSLRANTAPEQNDGEQPRYPMVVKVSWNLTGSQQSTTLHISDLRAEPHG